MSQCLRFLFFMARILFPPEIESFLFFFFSIFFKIYYLFVGHERQDWQQATLSTELSQQLQKYQLTVSVLQWGPAPPGLGMWTSPQGEVVVCGPLAPACSLGTSQLAARLWTLHQSLECSYSFWAEGPCPTPTGVQIPVPWQQSMRSHPASGSRRFSLSIG